MPTSRETVPVELFLEGYDEPTRELANELRRIVRSAEPESVEAVKAGWRIVGYDAQVGRRSVFYAYVAPEPIHVHLGFHWGVLMDDPDHLLEGRGVTKRVRWLTLRPGDSLDRPRLTAMLHEARRAALLTPAERFARALDRDPDLPVAYDGTEEGD